MSAQSEFAAWWAKLWGFRSYRGTPGQFHYVVGLPGNGARWIVCFKNPEGGAGSVYQEGHAATREAARRAAYRAMGFSHPSATVDPVLS